MTATPKPMIAAVKIKILPLGTTNRNPHPKEINNNALSIALRSPNAFCIAGPINAIKPISNIGTKVSKAIPCKFNPVLNRICCVTGPILVIKGRRFKPTNATVMMSID